MSTDQFPGPKPHVFGHRGAAGLAPENTMPAFALGLALGADVLELDVHASRDGVVVVMHDATLDRTTNGSGAVREHLWPELQALDAGFQFTRDGHDFPYRGHGVRIPTLESVLKLFPLALCNIEVKQDEPKIAEDVATLIRRLSAQHRVMLAAERDTIMHDIRTQPGLLTSLSTGEVADFIGRVQRNDFEGYHPIGRALQIPVRYGDIELVTAESIAAAHRCGLEVHVWTINDRDEMDRLFRMGVDGIISDLPGLAAVTAESFRHRQ